MSLDKQDKLAGLRNKSLVRDDESDPDGRIYVDKETGEIFHSVTRILGTTAPLSQQKRLENWLARPGSHETRDAAAKRGTGAHNHMEYVLKLAQRLARSTSNKKGIWKPGEDGLYRCPQKITQWAMEKASAGAPRVPWASSGYARGLRGWAMDHITAIHAVEFSGHHPAGMAGACDLLCDLNTEGGPKGPFILDWKTSGKSIHADMDDQLLQYKCQTGAYSLILRQMTGIQAVGGAVVVARRSGEPITTMINQEQLIEQENLFLERAERHFAQLSSARDLIEEA
jgi:hypothetical protein